jgi:hypothetical protein
MYSYHTSVGPCQYGHYLTVFACIVFFNVIHNVTNVINVSVYVRLTQVVNDMTVCRFAEQIL